MNSFSLAWAEVVEAQKKADAALDTMNRALGIHTTTPTDKDQK